MNQSPSHNLGTPSPNWASGHEKRKDSTLWIPAMIVGAVIFATGCGSGLLVGWFAGAASGFSDLLNDLDMDAQITVETSSPETIALGETFELVITVTDTSGSARTIEDIDFSGSLIENAKILSITPQPNQVNPDPEYIEHVFSQPLGASQSIDFLFVFEPTQAGFYNAHINTYMESYDSEHVDIMIEVTDEIVD